ncbi:hypothetical protein WN71_006975 [Streptomyces mangrovisoli]|uniref:DUF1275 family protein n=1 Tax=Streptomyces mangrovisoli TaxID=1428628 RepID=A0A1J4P441_9ACTN|nr:hypothetical protein WN71_006975 [Streptomyces mangrovisoli]
MVVRLLLVLTATAGSLDAVCVTSLDGMFASVITGNLVQLGRAVVAVNGRLVLAAAVAVGCYALGVLVAATVLRGLDAGWHRRTSLLVAAEAALVAAVTAGWLAADGRPGHALAVPMLGCAGAAMGVQSAVTGSCGAPGVSTTYLTGTLTGLFGGLGGTPRRFDREAATRLLTFLGAAAGGALLLRFTPLWAPLLPLALVTAVALTAERARA